MSIGDATFINDSIEAAMNNILEDTYPCPICKKEIPGTEPFCQDCIKEFEEARKAA